MMKKLLAGLCAGAVCVAMLGVAACNTTPADEKPAKIKDGISITVEEQKTATVDLSQYISIPEGTDYEYTATSSARTVATVSVSENIATITGVAEGSATVTASVEEVSVNFAVTVTAATTDKPNQPENPDKPNKPDQPENPDKPETPDQPDQPENPDKPDQPDKPETPEAPVLKQTEVVKDVDIALLGDNGLTLNLAENVEASSELTLTYAANTEASGVNVALDTDDETKAVCTFDGNYSSTAQAVEIVVTVNYGDGEHLEYTITLNVCDTSENRLNNGGFETGDLTGWTLSNEQLGAVSDETHYWKNDPESEEGYSFGLDGNYMFSAYATNVESASGTLTSSNFVIGGSGFITFKLGGAKNVENVYIDVIEAGTGNILGRFSNTLWQDRTDGVKSGCALIAYKADLSAHLGKTAYIRVSDYAGRDYGLFFVDAFTTYYAAEPDGFNLARALDAPANIENEVINGSFETGDFTGWTVLTENMTGGICDAETWWGERGPYNKNGAYHLDGWQTGIEESGAWAVRSSEFVLDGSGYISVRMGGNVAAVKVYKADGTLLGVYNSTHFSDTNFPFVGDGEDKGSWADMRKYFIDLSDYIGETLYVELHDTGDGAWAHAFFDEVVTYYKDVPDIQNGYDTVIAPVSKNEHDELVYGEVQLAWRLAVKTEE